MLKAGLKLISVSIKYLPASPSPSSTSLRYIPLEESASHLQPECWDGWGYRGTKSSILATTTDFLLNFLLPNHTLNLGDSQQGTKPTNGRWRLPTPSFPLILSPGTKPSWSRSRSHFLLLIPTWGSLAAKKLPLRCVFSPSQAFCSFYVQLVPQHELHLHACVLAYSPGIQQVCTHTATPMLWTNILPKTHCLNPCGSGPNNEPETSSQLRPQLHRQPAEKLWNAAHTGLIGLPHVRPSFSSGWKLREGVFF